MIQRLLITRFIFDAVSKSEQFTITILNVSRNTKIRFCFNVSYNKNDLVLHAFFVSLMENKRRITYLDMIAI